jgi:hypothetical protein
MATTEPRNPADVSESILPEDVQLVMRRLAAMLVEELGPEVLTCKVFAPSQPVPTKGGPKS